MLWAIMKCEGRRLLTSPIYVISFLIISLLMMGASYIEINQIRGVESSLLPSWQHSTLLASVNTDRVLYYLVFLMPLITSSVASVLLKSLHERQLLTMYMTRVSKGKIMLGQLIVFIIAVLAMYLIPLLIHVMQIKALFPTVGGYSLYGIPFYWTIVPMSFSSLEMLMYYRPLLYIVLLCGCLVSYIVSLSVLSYGVLSYFNGRAIYAIVYQFVCLYLGDIVVNYFELGRYSWGIISVSSITTLVAVGLWVGIFSCVGCIFVWKGWRRELL